MPKKILDQYLIVDADICSGCRICELACSMVKYGEYNPRKSHIKLVRNRVMDVNVVTIDSGCDFCAACTQWCPNDALTIMDAKEAVQVRLQNRIGKFPAPVISSM